MWARSPFYNIPYRKGEFMHYFKDFFNKLNIIVCNKTVSSSLVAFDIFYFLNYAVSSVHLSTSDSNLRSIGRLDRKHNIGR